MNPQLAVLKGRFTSARSLSAEKERLTMPSGLLGEGLDLPRGAIAEVIGSASSGRSTLLCAVLAGATQRQEACAVIDTADTFDPASAAAAGVDLRFLLWVRCAAKKRCALQVVDWLLQAGGFGVVALDIANLTPHDVRNIPLHTWFRFRRAVEHKPTLLLVIAGEHCTGSTAAMQLEMSQKTALWKGQLFHGAVWKAVPRKPVALTFRSVSTFEADACLLA